MKYSTELKCHLAGYGVEDAEVLHAKILNYLDTFFEIHRCNSVTRYAFHTFCFRISGDPLSVVSKIQACKYLHKIDYELHIVKEVEHQLA